MAAHNGRLTTAGWGKTLRLKQGGALVLDKHTGEHFFFTAKNGEGVYEGLVATDDGQSEPAYVSRIDERTGDYRFYRSVRVDGAVGIGVAEPEEKLAVDGRVKAKEVVVTLEGWADHVFEAGYALRPLAEVGAYVRQHGHLPGVPSEAEVLEEGVAVGAMQAVLLEKVEELTLYLLEQAARAEHLERAAAAAQEANAELLRRIGALEAAREGADSAPRR